MPDPLVIPGLIAIDPRLWGGVGPAEVVMGPLAGKAERLDILEWKTERWFLPREVAERHGVVPPERRLNVAHLPLLDARLREARLVFVAEHVAMKALEAGDTALFIAYHRGAGGGGITLHQGGVARGFSGDNSSVGASAYADPDHDDGDGDDPLEDDIGFLYDRLLLAMSGGEWSLFDADMADHAARIDPADLASFEQELAEIAAWAERDRAQGAQIVAALEGATTDRAQLPGGATATRRHAPGFTLRPEEGLEVMGGPIEVPPAARWTIEDVAVFDPPERVARRARLRAAQLQPTGPTPWGWILGLFGLIGLVVVWMLR
ncbi:hypothetical protein L6R46_16920 [Myxococcota bacterium]|nr:hypothetical protein [Myxococcota bacterium]